MKFDDATRTRILWDFTLDFDPTDSTPDIQIDDTWYDAEWLGDPVSKSGKWTQTARTVDYFAGPSAVAEGAVELTAGRHYTQTRITSGQDVIAFDAAPITVTPPRTSPPA